MAHEPRSAWQIDLLSLEEWTDHELVSALCGRDPAYAPKLSYEWDADQARAARQCDDAMSAGNLRVVEYTGAVTEDAPYGRYRVRRDDAIRWTTTIPGRFQRFPFTVTDLPSRGTVTIAQPVGVDAADNTPVARGVAARECEVGANSQVAATWSDVSIHFLSDERVQIVKPTMGTMNYAEMGFEDRRTGKPTLAWSTFQELAQANGVLVVDRSQTGYETQQKRVEAIRRTLKNIFGLLDNPLPVIDDTYKAQFQITWAKAADY